MIIPIVAVNEEVSLIRARIIGILHMIQMCLLRSIG
jgi:hypothetical protein